MLEKEAKREIMLYLYQKMKEEGQSSCQVSDVVAAIPDSDMTQVARILGGLRSIGYLGLTMFSNGDGLITNFSTSAIEYVEDHYLPKPSIPSSPASTTITTTTTVHYERSAYRPTEVHSILRDMQEAPCFNVDTLAKCYVNLIDDVTVSDNDNVAMLGIFAPWGRGKTYFFQRVKKLLPKKRYDVVEFNAWKYQETPALWAYLYESFVKSRSWWFRFIYTIRRCAIPLLLELILFSIPFVFTFFLSDESTLKWIVGSGSLIAFVLKAVIDNAGLAIGLIRKYSKGVSFSSEMGVQAEVEKELEFLLKFWVPKCRVGKKTVILYVDDIDRCDSKRIVSVIDSLRTVLENEEIRKRLVVICSVDCKKLLKVIQIHFKEMMSGEKEQRQKWNAQDQLDKLFLCSITLPELDIAEELEFIEKLSGAALPPKYAHTDVQSVENTGERHADNVEETDNQELSPAQLVAWIADIVESFDISLPPRAIRHIYYRCLLAMNILRAHNDMITKEIVEQIIHRSYGYEMELKTPGTFTYGYVVDMVVPYEYPLESK